MIITLSGRRVKRPLKTISVKQVGNRWVRTPHVLRALRPAKAPAPWAGVRYSLAENDSLAEQASFEVPVQPAEMLHLTADIECLLQWWDAFPTAAQQDAYDRERASACTECGGDGWVYAPVGHASERTGCPECGGGDCYVD